MKFSLWADTEGSIAKEFAFLAKAVSDDETRYFMNYIIVEQIDENDATAGLRGVSTDGRQMHIVEPLSKAFEVYGITPGHYKVLKTTKRATQIVRVHDESAKDCGTFPNWKRVLPSGDPVATIPFPGFKNIKKVFQNNSPALIRFFRSLPEGVFVSFMYLMDLDADLSWTCESWGRNKVLVFTSATFKALVMSISDESEV